MARYLLTCECARAIPVEIGQAGGQVRCQCGVLVDVPTLRRLRHLPIEESGPPASVARWRPKYGVVAALVVLALALAGICLAVRLSEPKMQAFDMQDIHQRTLTYIENMTPAEWLETWHYQYRPSVEEGFAVYEAVLSPQQVQELAKKRLIQKSLLIASLISAAAALAAAFWPAAPSK